MSDRPAPKGSRRQLYMTARWRGISKAYLKANPYCHQCGKPARVTDHVHGHGVGWEGRFWTGPFAALCWSCHSRKTSQTEQVRGRGGFVRSGGAGQLLTQGVSATHRSTMNTLGTLDPQCLTSAKSMAAKMRAKWNAEKTAIQLKGNQDDDN